MKLFLDMDGVIFDFFGAWASRLGGKDWAYLKKIPKEERDGDLAKMAKDLAHLEDFYANLDMLPGGLRILKFLENNGIPFSILSAPMRGGFEVSQTSIAGKVRCLQKHGIDAPRIFTRDKYIYATYLNEPNVLVDDYAVNIDAWNDHGGIGIKHADSRTEKTINQLKELISKNT